MGRNDSDDRINGPGWRDWIKTAEGLPWEGEDRLDLADEAARRVWHGALAQRLRVKRGEAFDHMIGRVGWLQLRLTEHELEDLINSASDDEIIRLVTSDVRGDELTRSQRRWVLTKDGRRLPTPRGGSYRDLRHQLFAVGRRIFRYATGIVAAALLVGGAGLGLSALSGGLIAHIMLVLGGWGFFVALAVSSVRAERALTACASAWPRFAFYRPKRQEFQTLRWRAPGAPAAAAFAADVASVGICAMLHADDRLGDSAWAAVKVVGVIAAVPIVAAFLALTVRAASARGEYRKENTLRKPLAER